MIDVGLQFAQSGRVEPGQVGLAFVTGALGGGAGAFLSNSLRAGRAAGFASRGESLAFEVAGNAVAGATINAGAGIVSGETSAGEIGNNLAQGATAGVVGFGVGRTIPSNLGGEVLGGALRGAGRQLPAIVETGIGFTTGSAFGCTP